MGQQLKQSDAKSIKKADAIDLKIAQLLVEQPSITDKEVAEKLGVSRMLVNRRRNGVAVQDALATALAIPTEELRRLMVKSLNRIEELLDSHEPRLRAMAATQLLRLAIQAYAANIPNVPDTSSEIVYEVCFADDPDQKNEG